MDYVTILQLLLFYQTLLMLKRTLRIATRKSPLALWQAHHIQQRMQALTPALNIELLPMTTKGDRFLDSSLIKLGGKGLFVKELQQAMLEGRADLAVHSMKDVPVDFPGQLTLAAICKRASPFDAFVSNDYSSIDDLPAKATVGTSSLRRQCQLIHYRPDLTIIPLRGNVNTRLSKLDDKQYDAIILAESGLIRLNFHHRIRQIIPEKIMIPACGQGALGIECRLDDQEVMTLVNQLACEQTTRSVNAERLVNANLGGNCQTPVAVYCRKITTASDSTHCILEAFVGTTQSNQVLFAQATGNDSQKLAEGVSQQLIDKGALDLVKQCL